MWAVPPGRWAAGPAVRLWGQPGTSSTLARMSTGNSGRVRLGFPGTGSRRARRSDGGARCVPACGAEGSAAEGSPSSPGISRPAGRGWGRGEGADQSGAPCSAGAGPSLGVTRPSASRPGHEDREGEDRGGRPVSVRPRPHPGDGTCRTAFDQVGRVSGRRAGASPRRSATGEPRTGAPRAAVDTGGVLAWRGRGVPRRSPGLFPPSRAPGRRPDGEARATRARGAWVGASPVRAP